MTNKKNVGGRPPKVIVPGKTAEKTFEPVSSDEVLKVMIDHAEQGGFLTNLGAAFYKAFGFAIAKDTIRRLEDKSEDFNGARKLCKQICSAYWDERLKHEEIAPAAWIFIKKNVDNWKDKIESDVKISETDLSKMTLEELTIYFNELATQLKDEE